MKKFPQPTNTETLHTEGDWRIANFTYPGDNYLSIQHYCTAGRGNSTKKGWVGMYYNVNGLKEPCYACNRIPPDGIQGAFIMLNWDKR